MNSSSQTSRFSFGLAVAVTIAVIAWASAWVSVRAAVKFYPPGELAFGRYLVASSVLLPLFLQRGARWPEKNEWRGVGAMGLLGFTFYNLAINFGEQTVTAGAAAFLSTTIPIFSALGAQIFLGEKTSRGVWAGFALSVLGIAAIGLGEKGGLKFSPGALYIVFAALCAAGYGLFQKGFLKRYAALDTTTWAIWAGTLALLPFGFHFPVTLLKVPLEATWNLLFLGVFPGALGYVLWGFAMSKMPLARLTSFLYLVPPLSVFMAWLYLHEIPAPLSLLGGLLALAGVILSHTFRRP